MIAELKSAAQAMKGGGSGRGFICTGDTAGNVACICDDNAPTGDIMSCDGMETICGLLGTGSLCNPKDDICGCHGYGPKPGKPA